MEGGKSANFEEKGSRVTREDQSARSNKLFHLTEGAEENKVVFWVPSCQMIQEICIVEALSRTRNQNHRTLILNMSTDSRQRSFVCRNEDVLRGCKSPARAPVK